MQQVERKFLNKDSLHFLEYFEEVSVYRLKHLMRQGKKKIVLKNRYLIKVQGLRSVRFLFFNNL